MMLLTPILGVLLGLGILLFIQTFPEPLPLPFSLKITTVSLTSLILGALNLGKIDGLSAYLLLMSLLLSLYDSQTQSFPLIVWLACLPIPLLFGHIGLLGGVLALLGLLAEIIDLKIGSGDLFYLATLSLSLSFNDILWVIQIATGLAIAYILLQKKEGPLAFLPFLSIAYSCILLFS